MHWGAGDLVAIGALAQVGVLAFAVGYARKQVSEAKSLRAEQTRPYVVVYADLNSVSRSLIDIVVRNVGQRPAHDVTVTFTPALTTSFGASGDSANPQGWIALDEGIPYIAPGQRMSHLLDSTFSRYADGSIQPNRYTVNVTYIEKLLKGSSNDFQESYTIDLGVWRGSSYTTQLGVHDAADQLKRIANSLDQWSRGLDGLRIYATDLEAFQEQREARMRSLREERRETISNGQPTPPENQSG